jgi:hypothetical protein
MRARALLLLLGLLSVGSSVALGQPKRPHPEPTFPPTCMVLRAGATISWTVQSALNNCPPYKAVELALGPREEDHRFVIDPITLPENVSLIIDGGVTVYGTTDASRYQLEPIPATTGKAGHPIVCGTVGPYPVIACKPLITLSSGSGIYGYGVIDGQGQMPVTVLENATIPSWWSLLTAKKERTGGCASLPKAETCEQAAPMMIWAGSADGKSENMALYKITVRNPPFHTIKLSGTGITAWGVKVQAPWTIPNSDGFDVHGNDILIRDSVVANGDQDVAITSVKQAITRDIGVEGLRAYGKGGVALLDDGAGISDVRVHDFAMTGNLPSVDGSTVNGMSEAAMQALGISYYGQALPSATHDTQGLQINTALHGDLPDGRKIENVLFDTVCIEDIVQPIHIGPITRPPAARLPAIGPVTFRDVHVVPTGAQFVVVGHDGKPPYANGRYDLAFQSDADNPNGLTLENLVIGNDIRTGKALFDTIVAENNHISVRKNLYPALLDKMDVPSGNPDWTFRNNRYLSKSETSAPLPTAPCPPTLFPFLTGELYAGLGPDPTGILANRQKDVVRPGTMVTLFAVVQPAMSQTTQYMPGIYGAEPGLLAVSSPPLRDPVIFFDNGKRLGSGTLGRNGTLATFTIDKIAAGTHRFTAQYADTTYKLFSFGDVVIDATP